MIQELRAIAADSDGATQSAAVDELLRGCKPLFARYARALCRSNSVPATRYLDDIEALVAAEAWELITEAIADPDILDDIPTFEARLFVRVRPKVRSFVDRFESPASGMVAARRRVREVAKTRSQLRRAGVEPKIETVIAETNARLRRTRKDAERQGMLVDVSTFIEAAPATPVNEYTARVPAPSASDVLFRQVVEATLDATRAMGSKTEWAATLFLTELQGTGTADAPDMARHVAKELRIRTADASALLGVVRAQLAKQMYQAGILDTELHETAV